MGIDPLSVGAGAVIGAVAGDAYSDLKDKAKEMAGSPDAVDHHLMQLRMIAESISMIEKYTREADRRNTLQADERVVSLPPNGAASALTGYALHRRGYKHVSCLSASAQSVSVQTAIGKITFALNSGWNAFDLPANAEVWVVGANPVNVIIRWGDDALDIPGV